jgi:putative membrane protein
VAFLNDTDRRRIEAAIRDIEKRTSGEIIAVIARASDGYLVFPLLYAIAAALLVPIAVWIAGGGFSYMDIYAAQLAVFVLVAAAGIWRPARMLMVPASFQRNQAGRLAREQFHASRLHETAGATGILLFVSVAERYVEILADRGINAKVPEGTWQGIIADFTAKVRAGQTVDGYLSALQACGRLLIEHFPPSVPDPNELPDVLIEI